MIKRSKLRLGKKPATYDKRDLMFAQYRTAEAMPAHPAHFGHEKLIGANAWQMLGNGPDNTVSAGFNGAGDCVFAGGDHETMLWTLEGGTPARYTGVTALKDYSAVTGYAPKAPPDAQGNNPTDRGTNTRTALGYRRKTGLIDAAGKRTYLDFSMTAVAGSKLSKQMAVPQPTSKFAGFLDPAATPVSIRPLWHRWRRFSSEVGGVGRGSRAA